MQNQTDEIRNPAAQLPKVSVIIPARNEEANLGACLESLVTQGGTTFEIIVVDDASSDRTREIARSFFGVQVLEAPPLPSGWTGKNNAVVAGARIARGEWLLFTDADTVHLPGSLAGAVAEAEQRTAVLLSYSPAQIVGTFWEKAVMPLIFAELAWQFRPALVSDPASPVAAANGQYLLISRSAYDAVGGHSAIAGSLLEDVDLARKVKASGRTIFFRYGGGAVRTRMYRNFSQLREGWTKNLALLFPHSGRLAALRMVEFVAILASVAAAIWAATQGWSMGALNAAVMGLLLLGNLLSRVRRAHFPYRISLLAIAGLPVFAYLLLRSRLFYKRGGITWKGRSYGPGAIQKDVSGVASVQGKDGQNIHELSASR